MSFLMSNIFEAHYIDMFILSVVGALVSYLSILGVIRLLKIYRFMDKPNERKIHEAPTPTMGGIGIFLGGLPAYFLRGEPELFLIFILLFILLVIGTIDDMLDLSAMLRLVLQLGIGVTLYYFGFKIDNVHGIFGLTELPEVFSFIITVVFTVGIINAFNLIDGINGLAGGVVALNAAVFGVLFSYNGEYEYATMSFVLGSAIVGFLLHNFKKKADIFMGDSGSLVLGGAMAIFSLKVFGLESEHQVLNINLVLGMLLVPVLDLLRVVVVRLYDGRKPFDADNNHIHHKLLKITKSHVRASFLIHFVTLICVLIIPLLYNNNEKTLLVICVFIFGLNLFIDTLLYFIAKRKKRIYE